ncbi:MAG: hypothetical protein P8H31_03380 [Porticoccaceae bacterium]|nr:hypothetical protein [Porticoccaceae bacterium]
MKSFSTRRFILLNLLVTVFTLNTVLVHSACFMEITAAEQTSSAKLNMPCHTQENSQTTINDPDMVMEDLVIEDLVIEDTEIQGMEKDCCSACSVLVLTTDTAVPIAAAHADMIGIPLTSLIDRTLEIPFRPPIYHRS